VAHRYVNRERTPIEAVYVFALDERAAVSGFEAGEPPPVAHGPRAGGRVQPGQGEEYNRRPTSMRKASEAHPISMEELRQLAARRFGDMVKAVVDLRRGILLLDAELHADQEAALLAEGSAQQDLWGINLYPDLPGPDWLEFDSMINLRPSFGNRSRGVDDPAVRAAIARLVDRVVRR